MSAVPEGSSSYDPVELGRRIGFAFSAGELQRFAAELGVAATVRWERGHAQAARDVVREFERSYGGLPTLVDRLRQAKPLVEWPDPDPPSSQAAGVHPAQPAGPASIPHAFGVAPPLASPGSLGGPPGPTIPQAPAFAPSALEDTPASRRLPPASEAAPAPASLREVPEAPPSMPLAPAPGGFAPPGGAPSAWPGTVPVREPSARPPSQGVDPKIFVLVAGLMVVAAVVAYLAGRAGGSSEAAPSASADASAKPNAARRPDGPATHLAAIVERGIANVARACEVPNGAPEEVFARSFEQCGPAPPQRVPHGARVTPTPAPAAQEPAGQGDRRARPAGPGAQPRDPPGAACLKGCNAQAGACRARCGPEPGEASKYGDYQQCMRPCITQASKCRLACP